MIAAEQQNVESWNDLQKRTYNAEKFYTRVFLATLRSACVIAIAIGVLLLLLFHFAVRDLRINYTGSFLVFGGFIVILIIQWINSGSSVQQKERERMIQERGIIRRCKYLEGTLPDGLSPESGSCTLYNKHLTDYPYCIYCKSYITPKMEEESKLNVKID